MGLSMTVLKEIAKQLPEKVRTQFEEAVGIKEGGEVNYEKAARIYALNGGDEMTARKLSDLPNPKVLVVAGITK